MLEGILEGPRTPYLPFLSPAVSLFSHNTCDLLTTCVSVCLSVSPFQKAQAGLPGGAPGSGDLLLVCGAVILMEGTMFTLYIWLSLQLEGHLWGLDHHREKESHSLQIKVV